MTEFELIDIVSKFYKGSLDKDKAIKIFNVEFGYMPDIEEDAKTFYVNETYIDKLNEIEEDVVDFLYSDYMYLKELQESGSINMFIELPNAIIQRLGYSIDEARVLAKNYMKFYKEIYYSEECI